MQTLVELAVKHGTDKWGSHSYAQHYDRFFAPLRHQRLVLIEIGIGGYEHVDRGGESLRMWQEYFPNATIVGIDLYEKRVGGDRIRTYQGDQGDATFLERVVDEVGAPRIVIDDGSHMSPHVLASFHALFPRLEDGGLYVVEDTQTSNWPAFAGPPDPNDPRSTLGFLKQLTDGLNWTERLVEDNVPSYLDCNVRALHFYHCLVVVEKGLNDEGSSVIPNEGNARSRKIASLREAYALPLKKT